MPILEKLKRSELQRIATVIADTRYDVSFDGRTTNDNLIKYIKKHVPTYIIYDEQIELDIVLPARVRRVVFYTQNKRGRKPTK